jgi:putative addiction module component (TIGR02574 family)
MDYAATLALVNQLGVDDRIRLVQDVWDGLVDVGVPFELTEEQKRELDRRIAEHEADPDSAIPWEAVQDEIATRLRSKSRR